MPRTHSKGSIKFVILSCPRVGSNLLVAALRDHPAVRVFGELMNRNSNYAVEEMLSMWPECEYRHGGHAGELLTEWVFNPARHAPHVGATGFKLFYDQAREDDAASSVWTALLNDPTVHVLHVVRRNLLEVLVSLRSALATDVWAVVSEPDGSCTALGNQGPYRRAEPPPAPRLQIVPAEAEWFFKTVVAERQWARRAFRRHPYLVVNYTALSERFSQMMTKVFRFLRLPDHRVSPGLVKQARLTPREQIENYEELRAYFRRTIFAEYFAW